MQPKPPRIWAKLKNMVSIFSSVRHLVNELVATRWQLYRFSLVGSASCVTSQRKNLIFSVILHFQICFQMIGVPSKFPAMKLYEELVEYLPSWAFFPLIMSLPADAPKSECSDLVHNRVCQYVYARFQTPFLRRMLDIWLSIKNWNVCHCLFGDIIIYIYKNHLYIF